MTLPVAGRDLCPKCGKYNRMEKEFWDYDKIGFKGGYEDIPAEESVHAWQLIYLLPWAVGKFVLDWLRGR